jgi:hypothetical protein
MSATHHDIQGGTIGDVTIVDIATIANFEDRSRGRTAAGGN